MQIGDLKGGAACVQRFAFGGEGVDPQHRRQDLGAHQALHFLGVRLGHLAARQLGGQAVEAGGQARGGRAQKRVERREEIVCGGGAAGDRAVKLHQARQGGAAFGGKLAAGLGRGERAQQVGAGLLQPKGGGFAPGGKAGGSGVERGQGRGVLGLGKGKLGLAGKGVAGEDRLAGGGFFRPGVGGDAGEVGVVGLYIRLVIGVAAPAGGPQAARMACLCRGQFGLAGGQPRLLLLKQGTALGQGADHAVHLVPRGAPGGGGITGIRAFQCVLNLGVFVCQIGGRRIDVVVDAHIGVVGGAQERKAQGHAAQRRDFGPQAAGQKPGGGLHGQRKKQGRQGENTGQEQRGPLQGGHEADALQQKGDGGHQHEQVLLTKEAPLPFQQHQFPALGRRCGAAGGRGSFEIEHKKSPLF